MIRVIIFGPFVSDIHYLLFIGGVGMEIIHLQEGSSDIFHGLRVSLAATYSPIGVKCLMHYLYNPSILTFLYHLWTPPYPVLSNFAINCDPKICVLTPACYRTFSHNLVL